MRALPFALLLALALPAIAQDVPLPRERPVPGAAEPEAPAPTLAPAPEGETAPEDEPGAGEGTDERPEAAAPEPPRIYQTACPAVISGLVEAEMQPPIEEGLCRERSPLTVSGVLVHGRMVPLSSPATVSCAMATSLPGWAEAIDGYLQARENTRLSELAVGTSYMCRPRRSSEDQFVSEHGFANALDVVGFSLEDGRRITVETGWPQADEAEGQVLRFAHDAACARFMTTLGPEANAEHRDHLHLDMGCHGEACTARLCE